MFWKKKKIINDTFGEIKAAGMAWRTVEKLSFSLFGKTYSVNALAIANKKLSENINALQESALTSFKDLIVSKRSEIEEAITNHFNEVSSIDDYNGRYREGYNLSDIPSRFVLNEIEISRKGECVIYLADAAEGGGEYYDPDEGFVVQLIPEIKVFSREFLPLNSEKEPAAGIMIPTKFKVSKPRKGFVGFVVSLVVVEAGLILMSFDSNHGSALLGRILSIAFFVIFFTVVLTVLLFKVQVIDSTISVRTQIGRCFSFAISEITKIVCDIYFDKEYGEAGIIRIEIANRKFEIRQTMDGFQEMAGYILEKLESGEMNETAVSAKCKRKLIKYKTTKLIRPQKKR